MRAMQIIEWGKPLEAREYPDPEPKGEEVLLRVEAAGVCHSDVHIWDGYFDLGSAVLDLLVRAYAERSGVSAMRARNADELESAGSFDADPVEV